MGTLFEGGLFEGGVNEFRPGGATFFTYFLLSNVYLFMLFNEDILLLLIIKHRVATQEGFYISRIFEKSIKNTKNADFEIFINFFEITKNKYLKKVFNIFCQLRIFQFSRFSLVNPLISPWGLI